MDRDELEAMWGISTHSLTRRLTEDVQLFMKRLRISTHSLTRRLTAVRIQEILRLCHFNSQPHKEADCLSHLILITVSPFQLTASQGG